MSIVPSINLTSPVAVYVQIKNSVMFAAASGVLKPGDQLVPVKDLGDRIGVNFNTVTKAYRELEIMGIIYARRGMGCFIKPAAGKICQDICRKEVVTRVHEVISEAMAAGFSKSEIRSIVSDVLAAKSAPYSEVPQSILNAAKKSKR